MENKFQKEYEAYMKKVTDGFVARLSLNDTLKLFISDYENYFLYDHEDESDDFIFRLNNLQYSSNKDDLIVKSKLQEKQEEALNYLKKYKLTYEEFVEKFIKND